MDRTEGLPPAGPRAYSPAVRESAFGARPPRFDYGIDVDAHVATLPFDAKCRGMFLLDPIERARAARPNVDIFELAGIKKRRVIAFFDYPYEDLMRVLVASATTLWPRESVGEGLRRLGRFAYDTLLGARVGKVLFAALGNDFARVAAMGARGWEVSVNFGKVEYIEVGEKHVAYRFTGFPAFLETYQVGIIEGAMLATGVQGEVLIKLESLGNGVLELFWD